MSSAVIIPREALVEFGVELLVAAGVSQDESEIVVGSLVEADLRGHPSHGVVRIPDYVKQLEQGHLVAGVELEITCETASIVTADARFGFGQVQMMRLIDQMRVKVQDTGIACGTLRNCGHVGRLGEWVERAASAGWAAFLTVNDNGVLKCVAPPGGKSPRISTNPIAIGVPTSGEPLVLDISTSAVANGKIKVAHLA
ncbi:MAG: Ldh family oxidoreductase, partial [Planctomycetes bacterium]|nr:Ldh family oxidoreductase [Planctomycetota bacterium]